jgi:hypothetical protein
VEFKTLYRKLILDEVERAFTRELEEKYESLLLTRETFDAIVGVVQGIKWDLIYREPTP